VGRYNTIWLFGHKPDEMDFLAKSLVDFFSSSPLDKEFVVFYDPCEVVDIKNKVNTPDHYLVVSDHTPLKYFRKEVKSANNDILWVYFSSTSHKLPDFECPDHEELRDTLVLTSSVKTHRKKSIILFNFAPWFNMRK